MEEIYKDKNPGSVWVGDDNDYLKIQGRDGWAAARMCKYGPGGHQQTLGYTTRGAPKGKNYLSVQKGNHLAVNLIDTTDPNFVPFECIKIALDFIKAKLQEGKKVLVTCNAGHSRSPSTGLAFLRSVGDMPYSFGRSETIYHTIYPKYSPNMGIRQIIREHWSELDGLEISDGK